MDIPCHDVDAAQRYPEYNHLYNKVLIAASQQIPHGSRVILPRIRDFPVIVRPIVNLYGMGRDAYFVEKPSHYQNPKEGFFWCQVLRGDHLSVDVFLNQFGIQDTICFQGIPAPQCTFCFWQYKKLYKLPPNIITWIQHHLKGFHGIVNLEMIGGKIIECHLRMGDANSFQSIELWQQIVRCYQNKTVKLPNLPQIYLIPVFLPKSIPFPSIEPEQLFQLGRHVDPYLAQIRCYQIDPHPTEVSNPSGGNQICNFIVSQLDIGLRLQKIVKQYYPLML